MPVHVSSAEVRPDSDLIRRNSDLIHAEFAHSSREIRPNSQKFAKISRATRAFSVTNDRSIQATGVVSRSPQDSPGAPEVRAHPRGAH